MGSTMVFSVFDSTAAGLSPLVNTPVTEQVTAGNAWPNPFTSEFTIEFGSLTSGIADIRMTDMQGRNVSTGRMGVGEGSNKFAHDGSSLAAGVYTVTITNGGSVQTFRMIKAND
ncbi:MAG: T9SS type A sorting domain-containing protein [Flavobacteriaceae bacterium]|nr:T9SS type A sorting domain-containing protein [Flavobacteriaceae bacterium]